MTIQRSLGVCYYPEHWDEAIWMKDAADMAALGLTWVRIGEFAWGRMEDAAGNLDFDWLDRSIEILGNAGLKVVLGTPTATPPRWMLDRHPDMLAVDEQGRERKFGSRRHYCFSHEGYAQECDRIVEEMARRYGNNPHVAAWQTDNEYSCHDTTLSYSSAAQSAFRNWLRASFTPEGANDGDISALNAAWGNVFWSMDYADFDEIDLPNLTVTEANPAHLLAFRRFSSDQVVRFNKRQCDIIRAHSVAPITHNFMGQITDFDHYEVGDDLDFASWDSYPLGFLEDRVNAPEEHKRAFARQGDPDFQAFHHDLYRTVGKGRWWVMEQQPGPVNWAPYNPAPLDGMIRLWSWEAFAHGAEAVCYFRWRQAPFAQEQMHAGLQKPDATPAPAMAEAAQVARELSDAPSVTPAKAKVALIFDYAADYMWSIQPHGRGLCYFDLVFQTYRALRRLGQSVDILPPTTRNFEGYQLVMAPGLMHMTEELKTALTQAKTNVIFGPRSGARDVHMATPVPLPPAISKLDVTIEYTESFRSDSPIELTQGGAFQGFREEISGAADVIETTQNASAAMMRSGNMSYLAGWPDTAAFQRILKRELQEVGLKTLDLPMGLRVRETGAERFWFNTTQETISLEGRDYAPISVTRDAL